MRRGRVIHILQVEVILDLNLDEVELHSVYRTSRPDNKLFDSLNITIFIGHAGQWYAPEELQMMSRRSERIGRTTPQHRAHMWVHRADIAAVIWG